MADVIIKKWNGTGWEEHYPKTTVGNIVATGTPSSTTFLRGDGTWSFVPIVTKADLTWTYVYGKAQSAITKGQAVQFAGVQGDHIMLKPAVPSEINANPDYFVGVADETVATNDFLYVVDKGEVRDINTVAYPSGTILWFASDGSTPGAYTATEPSNGYAKIQVGAVTKSNATEGILLVRVGFLGVDIEDIKATGTPSSTTFLRGDGTWATPASASGDFLPLTGGTLTGTISISGTSNKAISVQSATDNQAYFGTFNDYALIGVNRNPSTGSFADNNKASADFGLLGANGDSAIIFGTTTTNAGLPSERMRITGAGNVGIGTTSPFALSNYTTLALSGVTGSMLDIMSGSTTTSRMIGNASVLELGTKSNIPFHLYTNDNYRMTITGDGNIGIGTTSPSRKVQIAADGTEQFIITGATDTNKQLILQYNTTNDYASIAAVHQNVAYRTLALNPNGGDVSIGKTNPGYKLDVNGMINSTGLLVSGKDATDGAFRAQLNAGNYTAIRFFEGTTANGVIHSFSPTWANNTLGNSSGALNINGELGTTFGDWNAPTMTIVNATDKVGIGTSNPSGKFTLQGEMHFSNGTAYINTDPRWSGNLGRLHIWATNQDGSIYGQTGLSIYDGDSYHSIDSIGNRIQINEFSSANATLGTRTNSNSYGGNTSGLTLNSVAEIRGPQGGNPPALTFHYEGLATRHISINSSGNLNVLSPSGEANAAFFVGGTNVLSSYPVTSGSDFPNGTVVETNITGFDGPSWRIEVTGKGYGLNVLHFMAEGYNYNLASGQFYLPTGINYSAHNIPFIKVYRNGSNNLSFWWPNFGYWNSFSVKVVETHIGGLIENRVTAIYNNSEPSSSVKSQINLVKTWNTNNLTFSLSGSTLTINAS